MSTSVFRGDYREPSYQCARVGSLYNSNILSVFSLFRFGVRSGIEFRGHAERCLLNTIFERKDSKLFPHELYVRISYVKLKEISKNNVASESQKGELIFTSIYSYLKATGTYDYIASAIKSEIINAYNEIYLPLSIKLDTVSKALDVDFNF